MNALYLQAVQSVCKQAGYPDGPETCANCGAWYLPKRGTYGPDCYPCYSRGVRLGNEQADREAYARYVAEYGPLIDRLAPATVTPAPVVAKATKPRRPMQETLFGEAA